MPTLFFISSLVFVFRNEEKLVGLLVYSSLWRVATIMVRRISVFIGSGSQVSQADRKREVIIDSLRIQYSSTAQLNGWSDSDVSRPITPEQVPIKQSLLD